MDRTRFEPIAEPLAQLAAEEFTPRFGEAPGGTADQPRWQRLRDAGTEVWFDTGDLDAIARRWTRQCSAVTTNNTLLNKEVQKGQYDALVRRAAELVRRHLGDGVDERRLLLEIAFVLNARHALRLVEAFDAHVSVEEHTDLAQDPEGALAFARRFYAICPQRFYVKIPLTPAGLIAARRAHDEGIPVNLTLGFSARHNYLAARFARPAFVNVFLGRLNAFVADNGLGDGELVGERAVLASQEVVRTLRRRPGAGSRQIGASIRSGRQVETLAGLDVITMPTGAADEFLDLPAPDLRPRAAGELTVKLNDGVDPRAVALETLWEVPEGLERACDELDRRDPAELEPATLVEVLARHGVTGLLVAWNREDVRASREEGKIPDLKRWGRDLAGGRTGLDALMNLAGLNSFVTDQQAMDERVARVLRS